ncbi:unnamed protein product [Larinioides sclopetarius]|uniref:BPTI/Kunitz inhibitor domain-containing protein n=1 Tax=Larinioides sclopetarius TaxID=280406 RepID=A0AAV2BRG8_9ARAC
MWYYDRETGFCRRFYYGGCGGNGNRYASEEECLQRCREEKSCIDPPEVGPCRAIMPKWYYNQQTGNCHEFLYGGCQGNGNKYSSEEECLQYCGADND